VTLDAGDVLARAAKWVWVPPFARELPTPEYRVIAFPEYFADATVAMPLVVDSTRTVDAVLDDVLRMASVLGRDQVVVMGLRDATRPEGLEAHLVDRGGELAETLAILARPLTALADLDVPGDVEIRVVDDLETLRDWDRIGVEVFGGTLRTEAELESSLEEEGRSPMLVAYRDGVALGTGGYAVAEDVLRLWGGAVLAEARGTGAYRALLDNRLRAGREAGCAMALVKGRVETSAPVLRRAGFTAYGEERAYRLAVG
jgi:GNAT superfamily N-acetyltransferase